MLMVVTAGYLYYRHLDLLYRSDGEIIEVRGKPVLRLGLELKSVIPLAIADSFEVIKAEDGRQLQTPKYESNAIFQRELDGVVSNRQVVI